MATVTTVIASVVTKSFHHTGSVRMTPKLLSPTNVRPPGSVSRKLYSDNTNAYPSG